MVKSGSVKALGRRAFQLSLLPVGLATMYLVQLLVARTYSVADFGLFSTVLASTSLLAIVLTAGIPAAAQKYVAAYRAETNVKLQVQFLAFCLYWMTAVFSATVLICVLCHVVLPLNVSRWITLGGVLTVATMTWLWQRYICLGLGKVTSALVPRDVFVPLVCIILLLIIPPASVETFIYILAVLVGSSSLFVLYLNTRDVSYIRLDDLRTNAGSWLRSSRSFLISTSLQLGLNSWDIIILAAVSTLDEAGKYAAASRLAMLILIVIRVANTVLSHRFSALYATGSIKELAHLFEKVKRYSMMLSVILFLGLMLLFPMVQSWLGEEYSGIFWLMLMLGVTNLILVCAGPVSQLLNMTGKEAQVARVSGIWSVASIVLNLALIPFFGALGAAVAYMISNVAMRFQLLQLTRTMVFDNNRAAT